MSTPVPLDTWILTLVGFFRGSRGVGIWKFTVVSF